MGAIISRLRQNNDSDYEKILSDLDNNIRKAEIRLSAITLREKRLLSLWLLYSILAWFGYIGVFGLYLHDELYDNTQNWALAFSIIVLGLPVIFTGQAVISRWYKRKKSNEESELSILRADQRLKVEELKKKTAYYSTKTLLERYDPSSQRQGRPMSVGQDGKPLIMSQPGQRPQQGHPMGDSGLRHRGAVAVGPGPMPGQGQGQGHGPMGSSVPHGHGASPRGPQLVLPQNQNQNQNYQQQHPLQPAERHCKYALICSKCFVHNGLVLPQEIDDIQFVCKSCNFLNPSKKKIRLGMTSSRISTSSTRSGFTEPDSSMLQPHHLPLPRSRDPSPAPSLTRLSRTPERELLSESNNEFKENREDEDLELICNWHDSDAIDSDEAKGYIVESEDSKSSTEESRKHV
ncbi:hypothetical protein BG000_000819 [Podila horticola]|nr:hypothetical protein BG000_000819 [Podila horticola]